MLKSKKTLMEELKKEELIYCKYASIHNIIKDSYDEIINDICNYQKKINNLYYQLDHLYKNRSVIFSNNNLATPPEQNLQGYARIIKPNYDLLQYSEKKVIIKQIKELKEAKPTVIKDTETLEKEKEKANQELIKTKEEYVTVYNKYQDEKSKKEKNWDNELITTSHIILYDINGRKMLCYFVPAATYGKDSMIHIYNMINDEEISQIKPHTYFYSYNENIPKADNIISLSSIYPELELKEKTSVKEAKELYQKYLNTKPSNKVFKKTNN